MRGMTLIELMVVAAVGTIAAGLAVASASEAVLMARARAERSLFYLTVREARDTSTSRKAPVVLKLDGGALVVGHATTCTAPPTELSRVPLALVSGVAGLPVCFDEGRPDGGAKTVTFSVVGAAESVPVESDGRLRNSWGEFPAEGTWDGSDCDPDERAECGA